MVTNTIPNNNRYKVLKNKIKILKDEKNGNLLLTGPAILPLNINGVVKEFCWYTWSKLHLRLDQITEDYILENLNSSFGSGLQYSSVLTFGDFGKSKEALVRIHSTCHTGDIFHSQRCDCGFQLNTALEMILNMGSGALFYLADHEGRGIGLLNKNLTYILQEHGLDTVEANNILGFDDDYRDYTDSIRILKHLRGLPINLITNNPNKYSFMLQHGIVVRQRIPLWGEVNIYNNHYIETKIGKCGHLRNEGC